MQKPTPPAHPKKNKGGRPRKHPKSGTPGSTAITWKIVSDPPGGRNHYEISSQGEVRRKLVSGRYVAVKPWTTGGPYAAVYLYGYPNATRHRKKAYIHRLVATHFVKGRKKGEVVHHQRGPANNTAAQLAWVTVDENAKARKYFNPDGTRKSGKVTKRVPRSEDDEKQSEVPAKTHEEPKEREAVAKLPGKADNFPDRKEYIPNTQSVIDKIRYLVKNSSEVRDAYIQLRRVHAGVRSKNIAEKFLEATGKRLTFSKKAGPDAWKTKLISAYYAIRTRLEK